MKYKFYAHCRWWNLKCWIFLKTFVWLWQNISNLFRSCKYYVSFHLSYICSESMAVRGFPELLQYSRSKLLYREGEKSCVSSYRPISLPTAFSKIFYKHLCKRVSNFLISAPLQTNNLDLEKSLWLNPFQFNKWNLMCSS